MAQMEWSACRGASDAIWKSYRPSMLSPWTGVFTVDQRPMCKDNLPPRRNDIGPTNWGQSEYPTVTARNARDNLAGLANAHGLPLEHVATEQGIVCLPKGSASSVGYMPSSAVLNAVFALDYRATAISDRYYK